MIKKLKISNKVGLLGEDLASKFLENKNFTILCRNYLEKSGEIDIIAKKDNILHFVEVKSVSCENLDYVDSLSFRPEENVHYKKLERMQKTIFLYLLKNDINQDKIDFQIDVLCVYIEEKRKLAKVKAIWNIIV